MSDTASAAPRVPKRVAAVILNSLKGGVVPRIGLPYITVGREVEIRALLSMQKRELIYAYLSKGYADAVAAHETSILQFMSDFGIEYRILDEPLQVVGLGVAFALNDDRGLDTALNAALADMRTDGTTRAILAKYLPDPDKYLEVDYGR